MTTKQIQHLLNYLDYDTGGCDGAYGPKTRQAVRDFQEDFGGLTVDGQAGEETCKALRHAVACGVSKNEEHTPESSTGTFWDEIRHFTPEEFRCTCGGRGCNGLPADPVERLVRNAEAARIHFGKPATVSSGVRCDLRNAELPGSAGNSLHKRGKAMDFGIQGVSSAKLLAYVKTLPEVHEAYAIDGSYVHMGVQKY